MDSYCLWQIHEGTSEARLGRSEVQPGAELDWDNARPEAQGTQWQTKAHETGNKTSPETSLIEDTKLSDLRKV